MTSGCARASAERVADPDTRVVLAVAEVFGQDFGAAHHTGGLDDRCVPVGKLEPLAGVQGSHHDPRRDVLDGEPPERLDQPDRLRMRDGIRTAWKVVKRNDKNQSWWLRRSC